MQSVSSADRYSKTSAEVHQYRTSSWLGTSASHMKLKSIQLAEAGMKLMCHNCVLVYQDLSSFRQE